MSNDQEKQKRSIRRWLKDNLHKLLKLHNTPHEIALGVGIGSFIAIMPVYGLHTVMVIVAAFLVRRANVIAMLVGTNVSLPPTLPFITWIGYSIGKYILGKEYPSLHVADFRHWDPKKFVHFYHPLFIGSAIEGVCCAVILYFLTRWFVQKRRARKAPATQAS